MLVQVAAVEFRQAVRIGRKVRGHPVQDHRHAHLVQRVHQELEILRRAVARGRREVTGALVAPGTIERMFGDRHQLHMGEAHAADIGRQLRGGLAIAEEAVVGMAAPRAQMQFVHRHRRIQRIARAALGHPGVVVPCVDAKVPNDRCRTRCLLGVARKGVGLLQALAAVRANHVFVALALVHVGHIHVPDARPVPARAGGMARLVPAVEVADHRHRGGLGRPHGKTRFAGTQMAAQQPVQPGMRAFAEEEHILLADVRQTLRYVSRFCRTFGGLGLRWSDPILSLARCRCHHLSLSFQALHTPTCRDVDRVDYTLTQI